MKETEELNTNPAEEKQDTLTESSMENALNDSEVQENSKAEKPNKEENPLEALKVELQEEKDRFLRLYAEFDNFKKRTAKERLDIFKSANQEVMTALLPILDDFQRAMLEIEKTKDQQDFKGVELIHHKLKETLKGLGLTAMEVKSGDDFNTDHHEAITRIPAPEEDLKGKIVDVVETGYTLKDKVIRYAKVVVGE